MGIENVHKHIDSMKEKDLEVLKRIVAQPSVSVQKEDVKKCASLVSKMMEEMGIKNAIYETSGNPVIIGEVKCVKADAVTLLFYGHYDTQPPEPLSEWKSPPFEPTVRDGRLFGRGSADNKGQFLAHLLAVRSYLQSPGGLPINVKFILDGEEESGSPSLDPFVQAHKELLKADIVYTSDGGMHDSGAPLIFFGCRGLMQVDIAIQTAVQDNHSGNKGGAIPNAAWEMVRLLSGMMDANDKVLIPGFYDRVVPPSDFDEKLIDAFPYNPAALAKVFGVEKLDLSKREYCHRIMLRPTLTIDGIESGYAGPGPKTIIPGKAAAKLDFRLVADQDPDEIYEKVKAFVLERNPKAKIRCSWRVPPSKTKADLPICQTVVGAVREAYGKEPIQLPVIGATMPDFVLTRTLGLPSMLVPYANADEYNHAPNENMSIKCFYDGIHATAQVIDALGKMKR